MKTDKRRRRVLELLKRTIEVAAAERQAFLRRECGPDEALKREIEQYLTLEESAAEFLITSDTLFRSCKKCGSLYAGELDTCPRDGSWLDEQSLEARSTLISSNELLGSPAAGADSGHTTRRLKKYCASCGEYYPLQLEVCDVCGLRLEVPTVIPCTPTTSVVSRELDSVIDGKYRLLKKIGGGGFGEVYLAKHEALGKRYAVKVLRADLSDDPGFRRRFHEEALKLSQIDDETIVSVVDFGEWEDSQYMVTEFVDGSELGAMVRGGQPVEPLRAARILRKVARALSEAHAQRIVHLDLKPGNVLVKQKRGEDAVKVIDFGIAEIYSESGSRRQQSIMGTCTYMAPEQWRREELDPRADIYSFGVIFYELLTGRPPFRAVTIGELQAAHCETPPAPFATLRPEIAPELERIVLRCLEKEPGDRFQSAPELEEAIEESIRRHEGEPEQRTALVGRGVLAATLLAVALVVGWMIWEIWGPGGGEPAPIVRTRIGELPEYTNRESVALVIDELAAARASVQCRGVGASSPEPFFRAELERSRDGVLRIVGGPREDAILTSRPDGAVALEVPVREGENRIVVSKLDARTGERAGDEETATVRCLRRVPDVKVLDVTADGKRLVRLDAGEGRAWLSPLDRILMRVEVAAARTRLDETSTLEIRRHGRDSTVGSWGPQELDAGVKEVEVELSEGRNQISIAPITDRYGNEAAAIEVTVFLDTTPPLVRVVDPRVRAFGQRPASVRFECEDAHLIDPSMRCELTRVDTGRAVEAGSFEVSPAEDGLWEVVLTDRCLGRADERPCEFLVGVRDELDHASTASFSVLVDRRAPEITAVLEPKETESYTSRRPLPVRIDLKETYPETVTVQVARAESAPPTPPLTLPLYRAANGQWAGEINLEEAGLRSSDCRDSPRPRIAVTIEAKDEAGRSTSRELSVELSRESGEEIDWARDGSVLVYHEVCADLGVSAPFFLGRHEVSNRQYARFVAEQGGRYDFDASCWPPGARAALAGVRQPRSPAWREGRCDPAALDLPVCGVSWYEAKAYANWARLELARRPQWLAAAFWDYAGARRRERPWSDGTARVQHAVCGGAECPEPTDPGAGRFAAGSTPLGVAHLLGNVWELVDGPQGGILRVGGGFTTPLEVFSSGSERYDRYLRGEPPDGFALEASEWNDDFGFRCMLSLEGKR